MQFSLEVKKVKLSIQSADEKMNQKEITGRVNFHFIC